MVAAQTSSSTSAAPLLAALWILLLSLVSGPVGAQPASGIERPDPTVLQHGDLVWPRNQKSIVPYDSTSEGNKDAMKKQWESERDAFVKKVRENSNATQQMRQIAADMEALSYEGFALRYLADKQKADIEAMGAVDDLFSVGHVGIIEVAPDGRRYVIEAVWGNIKKVQRILYTDWLRSRADSWIWIGRMKSITDSDRSKFVEQAKTYLDRPYDFWNFDLGDDSSFYCSKLVWLSLVKSLNIFLDDKHSFERPFWFSPKQAWNSLQIVHVNNPRDYSY
jgi:uncharacterized protein YycO